MIFAALERPRQCEDPYRRSATKTETDAERTGPGSQWRLAGHAVGRRRLAARADDIAEIVNALGMERERVSPGKRTSTLGLCRTARLYGSIRA